MPGFDALAPDQQAVLQLLLKRARSYDEIAGLLRLERTSVRERALDALDALGAELPGTAGLASERQDEIADHLLGQQTDAEQAATRDFLERSAPGRAWALGVAAELRPVAGERLPDIPAARAREVPAPRADGSVRAAEGPRSSRLGGVLVLAGLAVVLALVVVLVLRARDGDEDATARAGTLPAASAVATAAPSRCELPTPAGASGPTGVTGAIALQGAAELPQQQVNLTPPPGSGSKALGVAVVNEGGLAFETQRLPRTRLGYQLWLWNSAQEALPLGYTRAPVSGRYSGALAALPAAASTCARVVLTRVTSRTAATPGPIVLSGTLQRG